MTDPTSENPFAEIDAALAKHEKKARAKPSDNHESTFFVQQWLSAEAIHKAKADGE
jgi:hypothetical protein